MNSIADLIISSLNNNKHKTAFIYDKTDEKISFSEAKNTIIKLLKLLKEICPEKQKHIIMYMKSQPMYFLIHMALLINNSITVFLDRSDSVSTINHIMGEMGSEFIFTDNIEFVETYAQEQHEKKITICFLGEEADISKYNNENLKVIDVNSYLKNCQPEEKSEIQSPQINSGDIALIFFSSGSTGIPKGITIEYKILTAETLMLKNLKMHDKCCLNILPCYHSASHMDTLYRFVMGACIVFTDSLSYSKALTKYNNIEGILIVPKLLMGHSQDYDKILGSENECFKKIHSFFYNISGKYYDLRERNNFFGKKLFLLPLGFLHFLGVLFVFKNILKKINLKTNIKFTVVGAKLDKSLERKFKILGIELFIHYGLSETGMLAVRSNMTDNTDAVGKINPCVSFKICNPKTNEVLSKNSAGLIKVKAEHIGFTYFNLPEETKNAFDSEGYFNTGDIGYISKDNYLYFEGRYKSLIVLNNGENISPEWIEELCRTSDFISQIIIIGQDRPYLTAIAVPDMKYIKERYNVDNANEIKKEILINLNNIIATSPSFKWICQIKNILLTEEPFTSENGLLTKKLTINKNAVINKYSKLIDELYMV